MSLGKGLKKSARLCLMKSSKLSLGIYVLYFLITYAMACIVNINENCSFAAKTMSYILGIALIMPLNVGLSSYTINLEKGNECARVKDLFCGYKIICKCLVIGILMYLFTVIGTMLFIIPGAIAFYGLSQVRYILAENPDISIKECLIQSYEMTNYFKWDIFMIHISFILLYILGDLTNNITDIFFYPYYFLTMTKLYIKLRYDKDYTEKELINRKLMETF